MIFLRRETDRQPTRISLEHSAESSRLPGDNMGEHQARIVFLPVSSSVPKSVMKTLASVPAFFLSPVFMVTENVVDLSAREECGEVSGRFSSHEGRREKTY